MGQALGRAWKTHTKCLPLSPPLPLAQFGLSTEWVSRLVRLDPERRQVLRVRSRVAGSHAQQVGAGRLAQPARGPRAPERWLGPAAGVGK